MIALVCLPGDRLIDLSSKTPRGLRSMDFVVSLEPFHTRFYIYQPGFPDRFQHYCSGKPSGVLQIPIVDGRFCVRESQPQIQLETARTLLRPYVEM